VIREIVSFACASFAAVFVVVDPFTAVPFFLAMTGDGAPERRRTTALRAALAAGLVLEFFALSGALVFRMLGVSLGAFKIAGGLLLLVMSVDMLRTRPPEARITADEVASGVERGDVAIVPLAMPLLAGPGSIATVVVLMGRARAGPLWQGALVLAAVALTSALSFFVLAGAARIDRVLGKSGFSIVERASGLLLAAIAIQFILDGLGESLSKLLLRG